MNYALANVWRVEAENYWHDAMSRLWFLLGLAVKASGGQDEVRPVFILWKNKSIWSSLLLVWWDEVEIRRDRGVTWYTKTTLY